VHREIAAWQHADHADVIAHRRNRSGYVCPVSAPVLGPVASARVVGAGHEGRRQILMALVEAGVDDAHLDLADAQAGREQTMEIPYGTVWENG